MELKELLDALDVNVADGADLSQIKDAFHSKYVSREIASDDSDIVKRVVGKHLGIYERNLKRNFKNAGVELPDDFSFKAFEVEDPDVNPIIKMKTSFEQQIGELKTKAAKSSDTKMKELEEAKAQLERDMSSWKQIATNLEQEVENTKASFINEKKSWLINQHKQQVLGQFTFSDTVDEYKRKGFDVTFAEKYQLDLDGDAVVVLDREGNRVLNEKKSGHASLQEVMKMELDAANMLKKNNTTASTQAPRYVAQTIVPAQPDPNTVASAKGYVNRAGSHSERLLQQKARNE